MLEPHSRRLLMESLQPPEGCRLDWAVGTTYTLDLMALLTAPVAFAFSDWQDREGRPTADPLALLKAVRQYASQICLFCQAGKIHVPPTYQPLLAGLEDSIVEANAPGGGSFHPKVWFLRFVHGETENVIYRVLCASRNMTFDRSWDTLLCLEGRLQERANAYSKNHPLGQFAETLQRLAVRPLTSQWKQRMTQLAHEVRRVEFEVPEPFEEMTFWPLGIESPDRWPFPERIDRMFVISPFVDDGLIADLQEWEAPMQLLSRIDCLGRLSPPSLAAFEKIWTLDDTANPEPGEAEEASESAGEQDNSAEDGAELPLIGLHAKLYVVDEGWNARVFTGSANATRAAFHRNVEFLVELRGKKSRCGIDALLGDSSDDGRPGAASLINLLQPYTPSVEAVEGDRELEEFERRVDRLAKELAACAPIARCESASQAGTFVLRLHPSRAPKKVSGEGLQVRARPVSLPKAQLYAVDPTQPCWVEFPAVSLLGLSAFVVFEAESTDQKLRRQFVLNVPLEGAPENRHEAVLRKLLSSSDRVLRFLLLLLMDTGARDLSELMGESSGNGKFGFMAGLPGMTLFESLVRALDREPERLDQMARIIEDLQRTPEGRELLPANLEVIWDPVWTMRQRQIERKKREK